MSAEQNKALTRRWWDDFNERNWVALYEPMAPDYVVHDASMTIQGLEAIKQSNSMYVTAFPDLHFSIEDMIAEGDKVVTRYTAQGTHTGDFMGIPPTGKQVTVTGIAIDCIANGKYVESWNNLDALGMLQQLGVIPALQEAS